MSLALRLLTALLALTVLGPVPASAQLTPPLPTWQNDASGRPAPPCFFYDPVTNKTQPCTATNPLPTSAGGSGTGQGTTAGTSTTGFGKGWFPSTFNGGGGSVVQSVYQDGATVNTFHRTVACGNCLTVSTSTDGGVNFVSFNTSFVAGNEVGLMIKVPSSPPRYLGYVANGGASHIFNSTALLSGWADGVTASPDLNGSITAAASNATGSVVLMSGGTGGGNHTNVCKSTDQGRNFGSCVNVRAVNASAGLWYGGGSVWFATSDDGGVSRSTNDGATWSVVQTLGGNGGPGLCLASTSYQTCLTISGGQVFRSTNNGLTWGSVLSSGVSGLCDYGANNVGLATGVPPVGFAAITNNVFSSQDAGNAFYAGSVYGSAWTGVGAPSLSSFTCNSTGRGFMSMHTTAGPAPTFTFYNPLTQPGGVLQSSAGGYNVSAPIQSGIIQNVVQTSAATTAQTVTLTGTSGSRVCVRKIVLFSSAATQNLTLVVQDAAVTTLNFGTVSTTATAGNPLQFDGTPMFCGQTGDSVQVVVGAAAAGTTTVSVVADRYPN
jgi:hypothetical protein